jgi:hypothetical protein
MSGAEPAPPDLLTPDAPSVLYGIVDTARDPRLYAWVAQAPQHACLFAGQLKPPLHTAAPYLVQMHPELALQRAWQTEGWGQAWGIAMRSRLDLQALRRHLRRFLLARLPEGQVALFRFYDPRVWRAFWPGYSDEERAQWLQGVDEFIVEDPAEPAALSGLAKIL